MVSFHLHSYSAKYGYHIVLQVNLWADQPSTVEFELGGISARANQMGYALETNYKYFKSFSAPSHSVVMVLLSLNRTGAKYSNHLINFCAMYSSYSQNRLEKDVPFMVITAKLLANPTFLDNFKLGFVLWDLNPLLANYP